MRTKHPLKNRKLFSSNYLVLVILIFRKKIAALFFWLAAKATSYSKVINIMLMIYWKNMVTKPYFCRLILIIGRKSSILKIEKNRTNYEVQRILI
jgi:hypothetical protein